MTPIRSCILPESTDNRPRELSGATNENIVQNHLNIALLKYFSNLKVDIGIFLSPKNFSSVRIS